MNDYSENTAGKNLPIWFEPNINTNGFTCLNSNKVTDVVIVGAGIAGLSTAYCLAQAGKKVIVIDDGNIGSGETGRTTAQIVTALDTRYFEMIKTFGEDNTKLIAQSHVQAINFIERTVIKEAIDCDFKRVNGYLFLHDSDEPSNLQKEFDALLICGLHVRLLEVTPGIPTGGKCIEFAGQAQFQPLKYLLGLCKAIINNGGEIYTGTHASEIDHTHIVSKEGFTINASHIVVATNAPVNNTYAMMLKQWAYRSCVISALIKKDLIPTAIWWDTGDHSRQDATPYHYVRLHTYNDAYDLLICGGEDYKVGMPDDITDEHRYLLLEAWAREHFPIEAVIHKWSGEVLVPIDTIAYMGRNNFDKDNVYIITGDAGIGMTYCTIGGLLITDLINKVNNPWEEIYEPSRFSFGSSKPFFKMLQSDVVEVLKKWFFSDLVELKDVKNNEAKIVKIEGNKCGAYRNANGELFLVSAECTHLKCMVVWNSSETSWDCPCHGSRFTYTGKVINGPANKDLHAYYNKELL
ncbi:MAG: FAD-dependent oxidoreductase [Bacteroidia bacterium]|nr:FAD-dependent oxidoreductase [Bacteroidia bacterium]